MNDLIAVAYAVTVDGFIQISPRAIRNPRSPLIVWMSPAIWEHLANSATMQGQFYIPCTIALTECSQLRALVADLQGELSNGNVERI